MNVIKSDGIRIGKNYPCFIIAEAGVNHNGSIENAKRLVDAAKYACADAVKFQTFNSEDLVSKKTPMAEYQERNLKSKEDQLSMLKNLELSNTSFLELKRYCDSKDIIFLSTPHTEDAADFLEGLVPLYKISSSDVTNISFLEKIAKKGKPIMLSTGMSTQKEVDEAVGCIKKSNQEIIVLHCTTNYPTPLKDVNLKSMVSMHKKLKILVGYSDHTMDLIVPAIAVSLGACVIEKHITLDKSMEGPDHKASLEPKEFKEMVEKIRICEEVLGSAVKKPTSEEIKISKLVRKSIVAKVNIPKGSIIKEDMLVIKRPGNGILPKYIGKVVGKKADNDILKDTIISEKDIR